MPDGNEFNWKDALPFPVFAKEVAGVAKKKAGGLHPFSVEHLQALDEAHPAMVAYHRLLVRCLEEAVFPAHYLQLIATLIPKTYGSLVDIGMLRDIWLINHGAKLSLGETHSQASPGTGRRTHTSVPCGRCAMRRAQSNLAAIVGPLCPSCGPVTASERKG